MLNKVTAPRALTVRQRIEGAITYLMRLVVGAVFIYSGYAKAIDPWGTIYKLREYLMVMHLPRLLPLATVAAFMLFSFEMLVGVSLVTGSYRRAAPRMAMVLMAFMLPLTLWIAIYNPVADCGCFGDAIVLDNWATFWKNVVLVVCIGWLWMYNDRIRCFIIPTLQVFGACATIAFVTMIGIIGYNMQPLEDYRPYPVGSAILSDDSEDADAGLMAVWKRGDTELTLPADSIPEGDEWQFVRRLESPDRESAHSKGIAVYEAGEDVTEDVILCEGKQAIVFFPSLREVSIANYYKLNSLYNYSTDHDIDMIAVAAGDSAQVDAFVDFSLAEYPIYTAEDTAIKEIVRGNPAMVYLEDGKIVWKNSFSAVPVDDFMDGSVTDLRSLAPELHSMLVKLAVTYASVMFVLLLLSHVPLVIRHLGSGSLHLRRRSRKAVAPFMAFALVAGLTSCSSDNEPEPPRESTNHTVLIYMVASNSLQTYSTLDLEEIKMAVEQMDATAMNVLVYYVKKGHVPELIRIRKNGKLPATTETLMTYPDDGASLTEERFTDVVSRMQRYAPADTYGLFLWSHSTNWVESASRNLPQRSFGDDNGREMRVTDLASAIPDHTFSYVWMDCCLMGSIEMAYQFREKCDYYVAYPTEVFSTGAPYDKILPALADDNLEQGVRDAAAATFDYYVNNPRTSLRQCVISAVRTSCLRAVADECRKIVQPSVPGISLIGLQSYGSAHRVTFYDLIQAFERMNDATADALASAIDNAVIYKAATSKMLNLTINPEHFSGLSVSLLQTISDINQINLYHELDWYKAVYTH